MLIEIIFLQELSKDLSSNPHQLPTKVILIQMIGFSKKKKMEIFKKGLETRGIGLIFLRPLSKKKKKNSSIKIFQIPSKIQDFQIFQKKKNSKFSIPSKNSSFTNSKKKKQKKKNQKRSSLNSSSGIESYDPLPYFPVVQHQVNCPPSAFFEAWSMSQTRGICQVCWILFNE